MKFNEDLVKTVKSYISKQAQKIFEAFFKNYGRISVGIPAEKGVNLQNYLQQILTIESAKNVKRAQLKYNYWKISTNMYDSPCLLAHSFTEYL